MPQYGHTGKIILAPTIDGDIERLYDEPRCMSDDCPERKAHYKIKMHTERRAARKFKARMQEKLFLSQFTEVRHA